MWKLIFLVGVFICFTSCTVNKMNSSSFSDLAIKYEGSEFIGYKNQELLIKPISVPKDLKNCEISPKLPEGLMMNNTTCEISGSSLDKSELLQYVITANSTNALQTASLWLEIKSETTNFSGFRYSQTDFSYKYPSPLFYITAIYDSRPPEQCFTIPALPQGISISSNCHISGVFYRTLSKKRYVVNAVANNQIFTQEITLEAISSVIEDGLKLHFDARVPSKSVRDFKRGCASNESSTLQWENLAFSSIKNLVLSGNGEAKDSCIQETGWYGDGSIDDPYRWRNDNSYMLSDNGTMQSGNSSKDFTLTVWARSLTKEFMLYGIKDTTNPTRINGDNDFGYNSDCTGNRQNSLQLFNKFYPFENQNKFWAKNDTHFLASGLFSYSCISYSANRYDQKKMSPWIMPPNEWHQITIVSDGMGLIKHYIDGNLIYATNFQYMNRDSSNYVEYRDIDRRGYFYLGGLGTTEFAEVKFYTKALNPTQIMNDCLNYSPLLDGANCGSNSNSLNLQIPDIVPVNSCIALEYYYQNPFGNLQAPSENKIIKFESTDDVSFFNSSNCNSSSKVTSVSYLSTDIGKKNYYMKINNIGSKTILVKSENDKFLRKFITNTINLPSTFSANFTYKTCFAAQTLLNVSLTNINNEDSFFNEDSLVTITTSNGSILSKTIPKFTSKYSFDLSSEIGSSSSVSISISNIADSISLPYEVPECSGD